MEQNKKMQILVDSPSAMLGYVYQGQSREVYWFDGSPENIASFLMNFPDADRMILTDQMDMLVLNTIGTFIDICPDKNQLAQILEHLIPMQMGETEPRDFFCPTVDEVNAYCNQQEGYELTLG